VVPDLVAKWEPVLGFSVVRVVYVRRMKTRWGGCNPATRSTRLNTDLAKKPLARLDYLVVHEMVHLLKPDP
jgi:predicted metal-dependent hydrolase